MIVDDWVFDGKGWTRDGGIHYAYWKLPDPVKVEGHQSFLLSADEYTRRAVEEGRIIIERRWAL